MQKIDASASYAIVEKVSALLGQHYVFPEVAKKIGEHLLMRYQNGSYSNFAAVDELCRIITQDIRDISHDKHLSLWFDPQFAAQPEADADAANFWLQNARYENFGFHRVERLKGNIGYLDLRMFAPAHLAGQLAVAAMNFLADTSAIIFDLRRNGGGDPSMIQLLSSYLFEGEPQHLNNFYFRTDDKTQQFWTLPYVPGKRMPTVDVFILTSHYTFSAAEEFTYNLQSLKRATIVGETTGGGAHPGDAVTVDEGLLIFIPSGRAVNPVTLSNWEGSGVAPDIAVPQEDALYAAHIDALNRLIERTDDPQLKHVLKWDRDTVKAEQHPHVVDAALLERCAGTYGDEVLEVQNGSLIHHHTQHKRNTVLIPMADGMFSLGDQRRLKIELPASGPAAGITFEQRDGNSAYIRRTV